MPRPIPIIIGAETKDVAKYDWWITMKVIEHGFPDVASRYLIRGDELANPESIALTAILDRMVHQLVSAVGRRHGIWVCTVTIAEFRYGGMSADDGYRDHLVAQGVRDLARAASTYSPLIMYDPNRMTASLYEDGPTLKGILRENLREGDLMGLAEETRRGERSDSNARCLNCGHTKSDHRSTGAIRCLPLVVGGCNCNGFV